MAFMGSKAPSAILKKEAPKSQSSDHATEPSERRVSWGNYRVREYLSIRGEESPVGPLIEAEDLISAPLSSNSHSSNSDQPMITPPSACKDASHMNTEITPDDTTVSFSKGCPQLTEEIHDDCPEQCLEKLVLPSTPSLAVRKSSSIMKVATPIRKSGTPSLSNTPSQNPAYPLPSYTPSSYHTPSPSRSRLSSSHFSEPTTATNTPRQVVKQQDDDTGRRIQGLRELEQSAKESISKVRIMIEECEKGVENLHIERERVKQQLAAATETLQCRLEENEQVTTQSHCERLSMVISLISSLESWKLLCLVRSEEGEVENYAYRAGFYGPAVGKAVRLRVVLGEIAFGEVIVDEEMFPSPPLQSLARTLLPQYLSHFKSKTHNQSRSTILDLAAHCVDKLLACFLGFEKMYRDFTIISAKISDQKFVTKFSFGASGTLMATTSPLTLDSKLKKNEGDIYTLAVAHFTRQ